MQSLAVLALLFAAPRAGRGPPGPEAEKPRPGGAPSRARTPQAHAKRTAWPTADQRPLRGSGSPGLESASTHGFCAVRLSVRKGSQEISAQGTAAGRNECLPEQPKAPSRATHRAGVNSAPGPSLSAPPGPGGPPRTGVRPGSRARHARTHRAAPLVAGLGQAARRRPGARGWARRCGRQSDPRAKRLRIAKCATKRNLQTGQPVRPQNTAARRGGRDIPPRQQHSTTARLPCFFPGFQR